MQGVCVKLSFGRKNSEEYYQKDRMNNEYHTSLPLLWLNWYSWVSNFVDFVKSTDLWYKLNRDCDLLLHIFIR